MCQTSLIGEGKKVIILVMFKEPNGEEKFDQVIPASDERTHLSEGEMGEAIEEAEENMHRPEGHFAGTAHLDINPKHPLLTRLRELNPGMSDEELREMMEEDFSPGEDPLIAEIRKHCPDLHLPDDAIRRILRESLGGSEDLPEKDKI